MPKVSIIVPNYNHSLFLKERLDSIFNQTYQDYEVILLDDKSTDDSTDILEHYAKNEKVSHFIINKKNSGSPFKQWKKGIELTKGECIWIAESDDVCDLNFLEEQVKSLQENDISVARTLILVDGVKTNEELHNHFDKTYKTNFLQPEHFIEYCPIGNVSSVVFKREALNENGMNFSSFDIIGDMMFYFENFRNKKIVFTSSTKNYFRKKKEGLSNLSKKSISYYKKYFNEHLKLLMILSKMIDDEEKISIKNRLTRRFNKIKNRLKFNQKLSFTYFNLYFKYVINKQRL